MFSELGKFGKTLQSKSSSYLLGKNESDEKKGEEKKGDKIEGDENDSNKNDKIVSKPQLQRSASVPNLKVEPNYDELPLIDMDNVTIINIKHCYDSRFLTEEYKKFFNSEYSKIFIGEDHDFEKYIELYNINLESIEEVEEYNKKIDKDIETIEQEIDKKKNIIFKGARISSLSNENIITLITKNDLGERFDKNDESYNNLLAFLQAYKKNTISLMNYIYFISKEQTKEKFNKFINENTKEEERDNLNKIITEKKTDNGNIQILEDDYIDKYMKPNDNREDWKTFNDKMNYMIFYLLKGYSADVREIKLDKDSQINRYKKKKKVNTTIHDVIKDKDKKKNYFVSTSKKNYETTNGISFTTYPTIKVTFETVLQRLQGDSDYADTRDKFLESAIFFLPREFGDYSLLIKGAFGETDSYENIIYNYKQKKDIEIVQYNFEAFRQKYRKEQVKKGMTNLYKNTKGLMKNLTQTDKNMDQRVGRLLTRTGQALGEAAFTAVEHATGLSQDREIEKEDAKTIVKSKVYDESKVFATPTKGGKTRKHRKRKMRSSKRKANKKGRKSRKKNSSSRKKK